jgi:hypothetical protein
MTNDIDCDIFSLTLGDILERLDRIENLLGITERTPSGQLLDVLLDADEAISREP